MKKVMIACLLSLTLAWPAAAKPRSVKGSEQYKTQDVYTVAPFEELFVSGQVEVEFTQAPEGTYTVSFKGPHNLAELVQITSQDGRLSIHYKEPILVLGDQHLRVWVAAAELTRLEVQETGEVHVHTPLSGSKLDIVADGKTEIEIDDLSAQSVQVDLKGEAEVEIERLTCQMLQVKTNDRAAFESQRTDCDTVMSAAHNRSDIAIHGLAGQTVTTENFHSSETELKGKVSTASLTARGRSEIKASGLQAQNADVMAESSSHIGVRVEGTLNAQTQGRGRVEYKGWPEQINTQGKSNVRRDK